MANTITLTSDGDQTRQSTDQRGWEAGLHLQIKTNKDLDRSATGYQDARPGTQSARDYPC